MLPQSMCIHISKEIGEIYILGEWGGQMNLGGARAGEIMTTIY